VGKEEGWMFDTGLVLKHMLQEAAISFSVLWNIRLGEI
jgi:hypothetical protein